MFLTSLSLLSSCCHRHHQNCSSGHTSNVHKVAPPHLCTECVGRPSLRCLSSTVLTAQTESSTTTSTDWTQGNLVNVLSWTVQSLSLRDILIWVLNNPWSFKCEGSLLSWCQLVCCTTTLLLLLHLVYIASCQWCLDDVLVLYVVAVCLLLVDICNGVFLLPIYYYWF